MHGLRPSGLLLAALLLSPLPAHAQHPPLASCPMAGRLSPARPEGLCVLARQELLPAPDTARSWWRLGPVRGRLAPSETRGAYRSAYPADVNDGALWGGRGASASLSTGWEARIGHRLRLSVAPTVAWSGNRAFVLPDTVVPGWSAWADPWAVPGRDGWLRPGPRRVLELHPGDSFVEVVAGPMRAGASTERLWWGPARRYPVLFSGTGPGFPHLYAETAAPLPAGPGAVRLAALAGRLAESEWFDADEDNDGRLVAAGQLAWTPGFVPGLELALSAVRHEALSASGARTGAGATLGSLAFRIAFPDEGIEAYGEIGRGALLLNAEEEVSETEHALVYTLGMTRSDTTAGGTPWRLWGELTKQALELPQPAGDPGHAYLATPGVLQGHTHLGRPLGSWIGPGSNAQTLGLDYPGGRVAWGVFAERVRRDDDAYYRVWWKNYGSLGHDLEWTLGARGATAWRDLRLHLSGGISRRKNRSFVALDGVNWTFHREWNRWVDVRLSWIPG